MPQVSGFDEWAKSSAQGESLLGAWRRARRKTAPASGQGIDRRALLKRAGIVGGAALVAGPLIQSVTSPAYAVSGVCNDPRGCGNGPGCTPCPAGTSCSGDTECLSLVCNERGVCSAGDGETCVGSNSGLKNVNCTSGRCDPATNTCLRSSGAVCTENPQCASGTCNNAVPLAGTPGTCK